MTKDCKVSLTYTITDDDTKLIVAHDTGDTELYLWKQVDDGNKQIIFTLSATAAEEAAEAIKQLAIKMRHEESEPAK